MTDEELINYTELHSQTERALFHRDHVARMYQLAGRAELPSNLPEWIGWHSYDGALDVVKEARARCRQPSLP